MKTASKTYAQDGNAIHAVSNSSQQTQAYNEILQRIIYAKYAPGTKLDIKEIMAELDLGRTPVREAILRLSQQGYVYALPQSGTFVSKIDMNLAENARFIREQLEQQVALEACVRMDAKATKTLEANLATQENTIKKHDLQSFFVAESKFHYLLFEIAGRLPVWYWLISTNVHLERYKWLHMQTDTQYAERILEQHQSILGALKGAEADSLNFLITLYMRYICYDIETVKAHYPTYFED